MEIEEAVAFRSQLFENIHDLGFIDALGVPAKLTVHIFIDLATVQHDRIEIRPGNNDQIPLGQGHVCIQVGRHESSWFVSLYTSYQKKGFARLFTISPVDVEFVVGSFEKNLLGSFRPYNRRRKPNAGQKAQENPEMFQSSVSV
jgi:hypothetical protein